MRQVGQVEDRDTGHFQDRVAVGNHLRFFIQHGAAGADLPGGVLVFADRAGRVDDMLHGVDAIRAADGGFGRDGGVAFQPGRIADGIAIREVGADIDFIGKLLAAVGFNNDDIAGGAGALCGAVIDQPVSAQGAALIEGFDIAFCDDRVVSGVFVDGVGFQNDALVGGGGRSGCGFPGALCMGSDGQDRREAGEKRIVRPFHHRRHPEQPVHYAPPGILRRAFPESEA